MKKLLFTLLALCVVSQAHAFSGIRLVDEDGVEIGTASNPIVTSGGSGGVSSGCLEFGTADGGNDETICNDTNDQFDFTDDDGSTVYATIDATGLTTGGSNERVTGATGGEYIDFSTNEQVSINDEDGTSYITVTSGTVGLKDDQKINLGDSTDASVVWQTAGNDNLQIGTGVNSAAASGVVSIMEAADLGNANRSPSSTSPDPILRIYSSDETQANDFMQFYHNQTDAFFWVQSGILRYSIADSIMYLTDDSVLMMALQASSSTDEFHMALDDDAGNVLVITNFANLTADHDHVPQTNPTLYVHSDKSPDSDNTEWVSITHDQTNGVITTGSGDLDLSGGSGDVQVDGTLTVEGATNNCIITVDADGTCDTGTAMVVDSSIAICAVCAAN